MFEGTLVESRGLVGSPAVRWTAMGSMVLQIGIAALLVALPLLRPERMGILGRAPELIAPALAKPPAPPVRVHVESASADRSLSIPSAPARVEGVRGTMRPLLPGTSGGDAPGAPIAMSLSMPGGGPGLGMGMGDVGSGVAVQRAAPAGPVRASSGVVTGLLMAPIQPVYPPIAKAAGVQGTVVLEAVISKSGRIERVRAVSGPEMLRGAAVEAVERARYQPYRLNGQEVEVQTAITVNFRLGD